MIWLRTTFLALVAICATTVAIAQNNTWVQIEAQPNEQQALSRADTYALQLDDVSGFRLRSGWYAIVLGPFTEEDATLQLIRLRQSRAIPSDSFLADGRNFRERFYGSDVAASSSAIEETVIEEPEPLIPGEETVAEARASERLLSRDDREIIQIALQSDGFYNSTIDASFGPGTRRAMAAWQESRQFEPTGVLTTLQRQTLVQEYQDVLTELNMQTVSDPNSGIEIELPLGIVEFDRYEAPFAHYGPSSDDGVRALLISQTGDRDTLSALYDILQTLEIVPLDGPRELRRRDFVLIGENANISSYSFARVDGETVKGYSLIWPTGDEKRRRLALSSMQKSFRVIDGVLPDSVGDGIQDRDLLSGLDIRRPERARSGFYVAANGAVVTTSEAVRQCTRITLDEDVEASVTASDDALGLALLQPSRSLSPLAIAELAAVEPRLQSDIAVAGYSFGGVLTAPSLTYGVFADIKGLDGNTQVQRLDVSSEPGDAGGPVFNDAGAVMGVLLDQVEGARRLPENVAFALDAPVLAEFLSANGLTASASDAENGMAPEDLTLLAADLTVLVSCWN
ncbi:MAG: serine protease [Boseongicola sp.]|nr:serine protease [Boseongicola sp.]MDD9977789.1 serine protease [Boseongicola sp.]